MLSFEAESSTIWPVVHCSFQKPMSKVTEYRHTTYYNGSSLTPIRSRDMMSFAAAEKPTEGAPWDWVERVPDAIVIANSNGEIVSLNSLAEQMFDYPREELIGRPVDLLMPDVQCKKSAISQDLQSGVDHACAAKQGQELQARHKDGSVFRVEVSLAPLEIGRDFFGIYGIRKFASRRRLEEVFSQADEPFRLLIEEVKDYAIFLLNQQGYVMSWNSGARRLKAYSGEEIIGRHFSVFYTAEDIERGLPQQNLDEAARDQRCESEGWRVRKDGTRFWAEVVITAIHGAGNKLLGFVKITRDMTERRRASEALLLEVSNLLISNLDVQKLLSAISACLQQVGNYDYAGLALYDASQRKLRVYTLTTAPKNTPGMEQLLLPLENSPAGWAFKARRLVVLNRLDEGALPFEIPSHVIARGIRSICRLPLVHRDKVLGTLNLGNRREKSFLDEEVALLRQVAAEIAIAIDNAMAFEKLSSLKDRLTTEKRYLEKEIQTKFNFDEIIGESPRLRQVLRQVETVAPTDSTVLILGETGTGKELIARAIHRLSSRNGRNFVTANCSALPANLIERELFGHEKGAFTGAATRAIGRLEIAHRGTLFLDEVGDIPLELQPKLLRALQERQFERLGSVHTVQVDVRFIAATNRDLTQMIAEGKFRSDLYYRLNVFPIVVPPLRERAEDIPLLARHFVDRYARKQGKAIQTLPGREMSALLEYSWPGNIRELEHFIERAVVLANSPLLSFPPLEGQRPAEGRKTPRTSFAQAERDVILRALRDANWIIGGPRGAAVRLGLKRTTLMAKMQRLGISRPEAT